MARIDYTVASVKDKGLTTDQLNVSKSINAATNYLIQGNRPNLILLDIGLPDGSGLDLLELIRTHKRFKDISQTPVIVISGKGDESSIQQKVSELAACIVDKNGTNLRALVNRIISFLQENKEASLEELNNTINDFLGT